jgi:hypothetical protein
MAKCCRLLVGFKALREIHLARAPGGRPGSSDLHRRAMRDLDNLALRELPDGGCELDFCVISFKNKMFEMLAGQYFDRTSASWWPRSRPARTSSTATTTRARRASPEGARRRDLFLEQAGSA